jgi:transketolase
VTSDDANANYVYYGVREFAMTAISNGMGLHECFIPYDATFLVFSDYARNAVRMSALMGAHAIHVYTHDSIGLGEDGPTHQPIEHVATLRYIPATTCGARATPSNPRWRGARRSNNTTARRAWCSRARTSRTSRATTQQVATIRPRRLHPARQQGRAAADPHRTGSEVELAMQAAAQLGDGVRVVSMPSTDVFDRQDAGVSRIRACRTPAAAAWRSKRASAISGASTWAWTGAVIGIDRFGASAPAEALFPHFGFTVENVVKAAKALA